MDSPLIRKQMKDLLTKSEEEITPACLHINGTTLVVSECILFRAAKLCCPPCAILCKFNDLCYML